MTPTNHDNLGGGFKYKQTITGKIQPLHDKIIVEEMQFGMQTTSKGLIILNDDGANHGIKPRWARVYAIGPEQNDVAVGQYILIAHGRWSRGVELEDPVTGETRTIRLVDNENILMVSDKPMEDMAYSNVSGA